MAGEGLNAGDVFVSLGLKDQAFNSGLAKAKTKVSGLGATMGSTMGKFAGMAGAALGFAGVAAGIGAAIKGGFDLNSTLEQNQVSFTVLFKSADKAKAVIQDMYEYAANTPYEFPDVAAAGRSMAVVGMDVKENLKWMGDLAAVAPATAGGITAVATSIARLKSGDFGESFQRLRDFGISRKMLEGEGLKFDKGGSYKGSAEKAIAAVRKIVEKNYGGMAIAQSKTWSGMLSTAKDSFMMTLGNITMPLFDTAKKKLAEILPLMGKFSDGFKKGGLAGALKDLLPAPLVSSLMGAIKSVQDAFSGLFAGLATMDTTGIPDGLTILKGALDGISTVFQALAPVLRASGEAWATFATYISQTVQKAAPGFAGLSGAISNLVGVVGPMVMTLWTDYIQPALGFIGNSFAQLAAEVGPTLTEFVNSVAGVFAYLKPIIMPVLGFLVDAVKAVVNGLITAVRIGMAAYRGEWKTAWSLMNDDLTKTTPAAATTASTSLNGLSGNIGSTGSAARGAAGDMGSLGRSMGGVTSATNTLRGAQTGFLQDRIASRAAHAAYNAAIKTSGKNSDEAKLALNQWRDAQDKSKASSKTYRDGLKDSTKSLSLFRNSTDKMLSTKYGDQTYKVGSDAAQGLANGVLSKGDSVNAALKQLSDVHITGNLKKLLDIRSPSKVMAKIGTQIGDGLNVGMSSSIKKAGERMKALVAGIVKSVMATLKANQAAIAARAHEISTTWGMFDKPDTQVTAGSTLLSNLQAQAQTIKDWMKNLDLLKSAGVSSSVLKALRAGGPGNAGQVQGLLQLDAAGLKSYSTAWSTKSALSKEAASKQIRPITLTGAIHVHGVQNPKAFAKEVMRELHKKGVKF